MIGRVEIGVLMDIDSKESIELEVVFGGYGDVSICLVVELEFVLIFCYCLYVGVS